MEKVLVYISDVSHVQPLPKDSTGGPRISDIRLVTTRTFVHHNSHPKSVLSTPNSDFRTHLTNEHFELSHIGAVKLSRTVFRVYRIPERPTLVAARSKTWVYGRSLAEIVGSNTVGGMDVC